MLPIAYDRDILSAEHGPNLKKSCNIISSSIHKLRLIPANFNTKTICILEMRPQN